MTFDISLRPVQFGETDGQRSEVFPRVTNNTSTNATDEVELLVDGVIKDSRDVSLRPGESKVVKLAWDVSVSNSKILPVTVRTPTSSDTDDVTFRVTDDYIRIQFAEESGSSGDRYIETYVDSA